ncbi:MAG: NAD(P)H-dependent oxidoreductase [Bacilli bacterium]|nr:NAD(P)H-dependent oxidoreductase [Bacilli bacterium]
MNTLRIAIILGSTREGRVGASVGNWVKDHLQTEEGIVYEIIDLRDYPLPFLGTSKDMTEVVKWNNTLSKYDGFIFITAEYNHSIPAVLKNALDSAKEVWFNKASGVISYGSSNGARAAEHLRSILTELRVANVRTQVMFSLFEDFNEEGFSPRNIHQSNLDEMSQQLIFWANALKTLRTN